MSDNGSDTFSNISDKPPHPATTNATPPMQPFAQQQPYAQQQHYLQQPYPQQAMMTGYAVAPYFPQQMQPYQQQPVQSQEMAMINALKKAQDDKEAEAKWRRKQEKREKAKQKEFDDKLAKQADDLKQHAKGQEWKREQDKLAAELASQTKDQGIALKMQGMEFENKLAVQSMVSGPIFTLCFPI